MPLDPIEQARQQLGVGPYAAPAAQPAPPAPTPARRHPMRPYVAGDGYTYQRRANIPMALWKEWQESVLSLVPEGVDKRDLDIFWVGVFCAWFPDLSDEDVALLRPEERAAVVKDHEWSINICEYYAADTDGALWDDIMQPAVSKRIGRSAEPSDADAPDVDHPADA